jgi:hypothetical protein
MDNVFHLFDISLVRPEDWVVDVILEIQYEGLYCSGSPKGRESLFTAIPFTFCPWIQNRYK